MSDTLLAEASLEDTRISLPDVYLAQRPSPFGRIRFQMAGGLVAAIGIPLLVSELVAPSTDHWSLLTGAKLIGLFAGFIAFRKMTAYKAGAPLLVAAGSFGAAYLAAAVIVWMQGLQLFLPAFLLSLTLTIAWFWIVGRILAQRQTGPFLLAPGVSSQDLLPLVSADFVEVDQTSQAHRLAPLPIIANPQKLARDLHWHDYLNEEKVAGREVITPASLIEMHAGRLRLSHRSEELVRQAGPEALYLLAKRYFDMSLALCALLVLWPFLLLIALMIRLSSPGPALFRQERMGYRGKPFTMWKFRSMRVRKAGEDSLTADMTQTDDKRITWIGKVIRKCRIDELPQIWNILKGEMSWIGPRPETVALSAHYQETIPHYRYRHMVRPGITGWAQVRQGHVVSVADATTKLEYDFFYVRHVSVWLDFLILILTIRVVLTGQGAK